MIVQSEVSIQPHHVKYHAIPEANHGGLPVASERNNGHVGRDGCRDSDFDGGSGNRLGAETMTGGGLNLSPCQPGKALQCICKSGPFCLVASVQGMPALHVCQ